MRRRAGDDGGNLMLLAGIVVTIAFVTTALTLAQVSSLERQAASKPAVTLAGEWRFLRDRLMTSVENAVTVDTTSGVFNETTLPAVVATFRGIEAEKGFDVAIRRATTLDFFNRTEASLLNVAGTAYAVSPSNDHPTITWAKDSNQNDGILWEVPCADTAGPASGCIGAVVLSVHLSNGDSSMHEVLVVRTNPPS